MDTLIENGIDWIVAIQSLGGWLELPMEFFTFLGQENFFFLVLPLVYWSVDATLGLQVALILSASNYLNAIVKVLFASPRPFWVSGRVEPFSVESTFGTPSGHAQNAAALWGIMAAHVRGPNRRRAWLSAILLTFIIGFSRLFLGMHFLHDVIIGWLLGVVLLMAFLRLWDPVAERLKRQTFARQIGLAFAVSFLMIAIGMWSILPMNAYVFPAGWVANALRAGPVPDPVSIEGIFTTAGSFFGLCAGAAWIASRGGYQTAGPLEKRALRYVVGLIGIMILWFGLGQVFPDGEETIPLFLRYLRYALVGFWVTGGAPWLFFHFKLAGQSKM